MARYEWLWNEILDSSKNRFKNNNHIYFKKNLESTFAKHRVKKASLSFGYCLVPTKLPWIELEILPKQKQPQTHLYNTLLKHKHEIENKYSHPIEWDAADRNNSDMRDTRKQFRIKAYLDGYPTVKQIQKDQSKKLAEEFSKRMEKFMTAFNNYIPEI